MSSNPAPVAEPGVVVTGSERLEALFEELAQVCGQRNALDGRIVEIAAEIDRDGLWGATGARSVAALMAWKTGMSPANAHTITTIAERRTEFPRCTAALREGRLSLDQVGVIAARAADGSDEHYAQLAPHATVTQLRTAIKLEPRPDPTPVSEPERSISTTVHDGYTVWRIRLPRIEAATFDAALQSHHDALIADWTHHHPDTHPGQDTEGGQCGVDGGGERVPPLPTRVDALMSLVKAGWDADAARRPHAQRTTVVVHVDVAARVAALHLGPLLTDEDRRYLLCDATCEVWYERDGRPIGTGRATRTVGRRLRRVLEHRDHGTCVVPGCGATRALHAHHLRHWEDGGPTDLSNLVLLCPYHHRLHHRGTITLTGPAERLTITDGDGRPLTSASLARPPTTPPPTVPPYTGPTGERAQWWWYQPYQPPSPTPN
ncbi:MAG: HNH endonuclease [Actinobacteria bacterium]|nr:HNH endonuclease [Actinomycetota bacterium]